MGAVCPACPARAKPSLVEAHRDRIGGGDYRLLLCAECGVVFSEPRKAVGPDWYEKAAPIRGREASGPPESDWRFKTFLSEGLPSGRLLDVGCGDGGFLELAARAGHQPTGFDYDERVASLARGRGLSDVHAMEFSDFCAARRPGEFDAAVLFDVLEHTPEPAVMLGRVRGLLKQGGHLAITLPNALRPVPWGREEHDYPPHHFTRWTPSAMRGFLGREGFEVVRQEAGHLRTRYLSDHFFFYRLMPLVLPLARRLLFGRSAEDGATISQLYERPGEGAPGVLSDKLRRQRLVETARAAFGLAFWPAAALLRRYYVWREPLSGDCLYTLARKK